MLKDSYIKKDLTALEESLGRDAEQKRALMEEAGIEDWSAEKLRNSMLSAEEAQIAKKEQLDDIRARKSRKTDWDEFTDAPRRWGKALHHSDIISRLHRLIPNLYVDDGAIRNSLSLYIWDRTQPFENKTGGTVFLGWMHSGWNPEYEIDLVNDVGVAVGQKRGWRTLLLRMICRRDSVTFVPKSLFTEDAAEREFGSPSSGETSSYYRMYLHQFRNTTPEQAKLEHQLMQLAQKYKYC